MKAIVCEMCGSQDLVKQDGMYVCQNCGTKYDPEEAKKLMIDVKLDNSDSVKRWYQLARQAKDSNDAESAAKYYEMILQEDPNDWESYFYSTYFRAMQTKIAFISNAADMVGNIMPSLFQKIKILSDSNQQILAASEVYLRVKQLAILLESNARSTYRSSMNSMTGSYSSDYFYQYCGEYTTRYQSVCTMLVNTADCLESYFKDNQQICNYAVDLWMMSVQYVADHVYIYDEYQSNINLINNSIGSKIRKYRPSYSFPAPNTNGFPDFVIMQINKKYRLSNSSGSSSTGSSSSGGCYVATAIYGSYDCPQVWTLRRYRDYTLAESWLGRLFIFLYYAISPTLVKWFGETQWFKNMWKPKLDKMVKRLNDEGVADTPYQDRDW